MNRRCDDCGLIYVALLMTITGILPDVISLPEFIDLSMGPDASYNLSCSENLTFKANTTPCCWLVIGPVDSRIKVAFTKITAGDNIMIEEMSDLTMPTLCSNVACGKETKVMCGGAFTIGNVFIAGSAISVRLNPSISRLRMLTVHIPDKKEAAVCPSRCNCLVNEAGAINVTCKHWNLDTIATMPNSTIDLAMKYSVEPTLPRGIFSNLTRLKNIDLGKNNISTVDPNAFDGLSSVEKIQLHKNRILHFGVEHCEEFPTSLKSLRLDGNKLTRLQPGIFQACSGLAALKLSRNNLTKLENGTFKGLDKLISVTLEKNQISHIEQGALDGLFNLHNLDLSDNNLSSIQTLIFKNLSELQILELRMNPWRSIEPFAFAGLHNLNILFINRLSKYWKDSHMGLNSFQGLDNLEVLNVDDHRICCLLPNSSTVCNKETIPPLFDSCDQRLLPSYAERTLLWIFSISSILGNVYVIIVRCRGQMHIRNQTQSILILNLAVSDLFMGFYMMIIACADLAYGPEFVLFANDWTSSRLCKFAGLLSFFSSEASVLFVVLISVDRLLCIVLPYGKKRMSAETARYASALVWIIVILLGATAIILQENTNTYGLASVCVGLPLVSSKEYEKTSDYIDHNIEGADGQLTLYKYKEKDSRSNWQFAIAIFLGLNFIAFFIVLACYLTIATIVAVKLPSKSMQRKKDRTREIKMAARMALIVLTDLFCWMPVIIIGILVQSSAVSDTKIRNNYSWVVALVLPLNAALNPYLYTFASDMRHRPRTKDGERYALNTRIPTCSNSQNRTRATNL